MNALLNTTPLHQWHKQANANMADFGGYDMPLWYETGVKAEHLSVLKSAGIFDTSHMACISVEGDAAFDLLNRCFTRNLFSLKPGRCVYGAFLNEKGHCIDDAIVYKFSDPRFMVCVNAGMGQTIADHLESHRSAKDCRIKDLSGNVAKMDIQGVNSARILSKLIESPDTVFTGMPYFSFKGHFDPQSPEAPAVRLLNGTPVLLSRSGYTGEFGFEIFLDPAAIVALWTDILEAGNAFDVTACGLGARDSLRTGACLPLSHQDIGSYKFINHPWEFALPWTPDKTAFTKEFIGSRALLPRPANLYVFPFAGTSLKKVPAGPDTQVFEQGQEDPVGSVLTCATDMGLGMAGGRLVSIASPGLAPDTPIKGISCGFVMVSRPFSPGTAITLKLGKRSIDAAIVTDIRPHRTARKKLENFLDH